MDEVNIGYRKMLNEKGHIMEEALDSFFYSKTRVYATGSLVWSNHQPVKVQYRENDPDEYTFSMQEATQEDLGTFKVVEALCEDVMN